MSKNDSRKISQKQLLRIFTDLKTHTDDGMCFLLGAGASFTSGIPTGGELAKRWYEKLKAEDLTPAELSAWQHNVDGFDENNLAKFYTQIFEKRFDNPSTGFYELQDLMKDAKPSIGYSFLAQILADPKLSNKFVITTNFDHMVEDALRLYTTERPLVCGHESLAEYVSTHSIRPTIIKIHRDLLLHPFNKAGNTDTLKEEWQKTLKPILQHYHLVVIGYGGNDGSLMDYLRDMKENRRSIYWCYRSESELDERILKLLDKDYDRLVKITGFDQFMLALGDLYDCPRLINQDDLSKSQLVINALNEAERYQQQLETFAEKTVKDDKGDTDTTEALAKLFDGDGKPLKHWWQVEMKVDEEPDNDRKDALYQDGIKQFSDSLELLGDYAVFLTEIRKDYNQAEIYYRKVLELAPDDTDYNGNYALFLTDIRKDYDQAESYYRKALELDPDHANNNINYALFLKNIRKDYDQAESYYRKALELEPDNVIINGNYAGLLLALGRKAEANPYLAIAMQANDRQDLLLECWFYRLAHFPELHEQAKQEIEALLKQGGRSIGWDFSANIARAEQDGYADMDELRRIAAEITNE
jgi:tetratricopeptide (TPR) repeat protein